MASNATTSLSPAPRQKLRVMVITMGGPRRDHIQAMFDSPEFSFFFEPPVFSPGVPSRSLRNRREFFRQCHEAGLIPPAEWQAIRVAHDENPIYQKNPQRFHECLENIPVGQGRRGSQADVKLHFSLELWRKAKGLNRGRAVLACMLAHLIALKTFTKEDYGHGHGGFDILLEDNVRAPLGQETARRVRQALLASQEYERATGHKCHLRYFGWLGSILNLEWIYRSHIPKHGQQDGISTTITTTTTNTSDHYSWHSSMVPFPTTQDIEKDLEFSSNQKDSGPYQSQLLEAANLEEGEDKESQVVLRHDKPGGTPVWGNFAYWLSRDGYLALLDILRSDVGAMLFKHKRARCYTVKPVDKVFPRQLMNRFGQESVQITTQPTFFRAPMLTSKIHTQWDPEFCKSTEYQLQQNGLSWSDLWLTETERQVVKYRNDHGEWLTPAQLDQQRMEQMKSMQMTTTTTTTTQQGKMEQKS